MSPRLPLKPAVRHRRMVWVAMLMLLAAGARWLYQAGEPLPPMTVSAGPLQPLGSVLPTSLGPAEHPAARSVPAAVLGDPAQNTATATATAIATATATANATATASAPVTGLAAIVQP